MGISSNKLELELKTVLHDLQRQYAVFQQRKNNPNYAGFLDAKNMFTKAYSRAMEITASYAAMSYNNDSACNDLYDFLDDEVGKGISGNEWIEGIRRVNAWIVLMRTGECSYLDKCMEHPVSFKKNNIPFQERPTEEIPLEAIPKQ